MNRSNYDERNENQQHVAKNLDVGIVVNNAYVQGADAQGMDPIYLQQLDLQD